MAILDTDVSVGFCQFYRCQGDGVIRVLIYSGKPERLACVQNEVVAYFRRVRRGYAVTGCGRYQDAVDYLGRDGAETDIFLCDFTEFDRAFALTLRLRACNRLASWVYLGEGLNALPNALYTRPSAYVARPEEPRALMPVLKRLESFHQRLQKERFFSFRCQGEQLRIPYGGISHFESNAKKVTLHLAGSPRRYEFTAKLDDIAAGLPDTFLRCHQSYLVNMDMIRLLDTRQRLFVLSNDTEILISPRIYPQARERYQQYTEGRQ